MDNNNQVNPMPPQQSQSKQTSRILNQIDLTKLEEQVAKVTAWKGGEPLMTRD